MHDSHELDKATHLRSERKKFRLAALIYPFCVYDFLIEISQVFSLSQVMSQSTRDSSASPWLNPHLWCILLFAECQKAQWIGPYPVHSVTGQRFWWACLWLVYRETGHNGETAGQDSSPERSSLGPLLQHGNIAKK